MENEAPQAAVNIRVLMAHNKKGFQGAGQDLPQMSIARRFHTHSSKCAIGYDYSMVLPHLRARFYRAYQDPFQWPHMDLSSY